jgi:hypothetical protein
MTPWHYKMTLNDRKNPGVKHGTPTFMLLPFWQSIFFCLTPGRSLSVSLASRNNAVFGVERSAVLRQASANHIVLTTLECSDNFSFEFF